jgi:hypothetical protein
VECVPLDGGYLADDEDDRGEGREVRYNGYLMMVIREPGPRAPD